MTLQEKQNQLIIDYYTKGKNNIIDQAIISLLIYTKSGKDIFNQLEFNSYLNTFKRID
jgi:hypothetical protein